MRSLLDVLQSSLVDHPADTGAENEVRYKLIIDPSEDGSLVRLLFSSGVLARRNTRVYVCSDFPGDAELQKVCFHSQCICFYPFVLVYLIQSNIHTLTTVWFEIDFAITLSEYDPIVLHSCTP